MSFWNLSDNTQVNNEATFEQEGGSMEPIPNNTTCTAYIEEIKWDKGFNTEAELINIRWRVLAPNTYANRVIFQKLWVDGDDPQAKDPAKKRDNAKRMLGAINVNTGNGLPQSRPTDVDLQSNLMQKPMNIKVMKWEMKQDDGSVKDGNWISAVAPRAAVQEPPKPEVVQQVRQQMVDTSEEIPF